MNPIICPTCGASDIDPHTPKEIRILKFRLGAPARELRETRRHLRDLTSAVSAAVRALDEEMNRPASHERGKRIAKIRNFLELNNDLAKRFGL